MDVNHKRTSGLELALQYWNFARPLLERQIPAIMENAAAGLAGEGSECFNCDDALSEDHDFGPGFCVWLPEKIWLPAQQQISAAFASLPDEFEGMPTRNHIPGRTGAMAIEKFYAFFTGLGKPPENWREWLEMPEERLAAATNGEVFMDKNGLFTRWRNRLINFYPEDVRLKKIASACMQMAQAGQYNLPRALKRGDGTSAMLCVGRFADAALSFAFLINKRYKPFYKWAPRLARSLPTLGSELAHLLSQLARHPLRDSRDMGAAELVEEFCGSCAALLRRLDLSAEQGAWLWAHGPAIMNNVRTDEIRRLNLLDG